nr:hydroxyethylthiazole kinase [Janibacter limosus]
MLPTARVAVSAGIPWVLDPTAIGLAPVRTRMAHELLALGPTAVRGNGSEVVTLAGGAGGGRGADSTLAPDAAAAAAREVAVRHGCVVAVSGAVDVITDGGRTTRVDSGSPTLTGVTGTGCLLGALTAAHPAAAPPFVATVAATALLTVASERVTHPGPGSFRVALLDALDALTPAEVAQEVRLSWG